MVAGAGGVDRGDELGACRLVLFVGAPRPHRVVRRERPHGSRIRPGVGVGDRGERAVDQLGGHDGAQVVVPVAGTGTPDVCLGGGAAEHRGQQRAQLAADGQHPFVRGLQLGGFGGSGHEVALDEDLVVHPEAAGEAEPGVVVVELGQELGAVLDAVDRDREHLDPHRFVVDQAGEHRDVVAQPVVAVGVALHHGGAEDLGQHLLGGEPHALEGGLDGQDERVAVGAADADGVVGEVRNDDGDRTLESDQGVGQLAGRHRCGARSLRPGAQLELGETQAGPAEVDHDPLAADDGEPEQRVRLLVVDVLDRRTTPGHVDEGRQLFGVDLGPRAVGGQLGREDLVDAGIGPRVRGDRQGLRVGAGGDGEHRAVVVGDQVDGGRLAGERPAEGELDQSG